MCQVLPGIYLSQKSKIQSYFRENNQKKSRGILFQIIELSATIMCGDVNENYNYGLQWFWEINFG